MNSIKGIKDQISKLENTLRSIQNKCSHPSESVIKEHKGSTGNYDPSEDCYWTNFYCSLCEKRWTEAGSK